MQTPIYVYIKKKSRKATFCLDTRRHINKTHTSFLSSSWAYSAKLNFKQLLNQQGLHLMSL